MAKSLEEKLATARAWKARNSERVKAYRAVYFQAHKDDEHANHLRWHARNPGRKSEFDKTYRERHADRLAEIRATDEYRERKQRRFRHRYGSDLGFRKILLIRFTVWQALRRTQSSEVIVEIVGCTLAQLRDHIASQFKPGMTWANWGDWEIDHRRPVCSFDATDDEQMKECFHFTNLQPLWKHENVEKGSKWDPVSHEKQQQQTAESK